MKHVVIDAQGFPSAFYDSDIHGGDIPVAAIPITGEQWQDLIDNAGRRKLVEGEVVVFDPSPPVVDLVAYAADRRWRNEVGGIVIAGIPIATDDRAKLMITGARVAAMADPNWSTEWHGTDGNTYPVDAATMVMISDAVQRHVNASFATFAQVKAEIGAGTITATDQIDAAFGG